MERTNRAILLRKEGRRLLAHFRLWDIFGGGEGYDLRILLLFPWILHFELYLYLQTDVIQQLSK